MPHDLREALLGLEAPGSFAFRCPLPTDDLVLEIKKMGPVPFPITATAARELMGEAVRSPFGWRDQTITDLGVRDGWQIAKSRLRIDGRRWNPVLRSTLEEIREQLGLPNTGRLTARLDKLTIYGPGQFFKTHQDTEKSDHMIGTLVVVLPSHFTGGAIKIERNKERAEFRRSMRKIPKLDLIAFYSDCHHEVRPIKTGYRVALIYILDFDAGRTHAPKPVSAPTHDAQIEAVKQAVQAHFSTPQPVRYSRDNDTRIPEKLVYLLDHEYTQRNLGWSRLKQSDSMRALALRDTAAQLDLEVFLCLADVHEIWQCEPEIHSYWSRRNHWHDDDDDDDTPDPTDLIESEIDLRHWQDSSGADANFEGLGVDDSEICFTTASDDLEPFESHYEGYMGNSGDTLDRWYHRAAVVLWPKSNEFRVLVKTSPKSAIKRLLDGYGGRQPSNETTQEHLRTLLELWPRYAHTMGGKTLSAVVLRLALALGDASSAAKLLGPLAPQAVSTRSLRPWLALMQRYGMAWSRRILSAWHEPPSPHRRSESPWATYSPEWLDKLANEDTKTGRKLAEFIVDQQWVELRRRFATMKPYRTRSLYVRYRGPEFIEQTLGLLRAAAALNMHKPLNAAIGQLRSKDSALSPLDVAIVVSKMMKAFDAEAWAAWNLEELLTHSRETLESRIDEIQREEGDWSITVPRNCSCGDCAELHAYLHSTEVTLEWPMAKQRRFHIHRTIDAMGLPVKHVTQRRGSPHVLVLTKTDDLFRRDADLCRRYELSLAELEQAPAKKRVRGKRT